MLFKEGEEIGINDRNGKPIKYGDTVLYDGVYKDKVVLGWQRIDAFDVYGFPWADHYDNYYKPDGSRVIKNLEIIKDAI